MPSAIAPRVMRASDAGLRFLAARSAALMEADSAVAVRLTPPEVNAWIAEDARSAGMPGVPFRIGIHRTMKGGIVDCASGGRWTVGPEGERFWTARIESPGARALRVRFAQFDLPATTRCLVGDASSARIDTYENKGLGGRGNFWSDVISGDVALIEFQDLRGGSAVPVIAIDQVSHIYRDPLSPGGDEEAVSSPPDLLPCEQDVSCHQVDPIARDAVGRMVFSIGSATWTCSGALLNDADANTYAGYFLTANHCINSQEAADSLTVYWFYQSSVCNGPEPGLATLPKSSGATVLSTAGSSDFTLLRLADDPSDGQGLAAWTTADPTGTVVGIHHPQATHKRVSFGTLTTVGPICPEYPLSHYWYLDWDLGITESGSSGSPLFDSQWRVVGQLFGLCLYAVTVPACDNQDRYNTVYGKFGMSYAGIAPFLASVAPDDPYEDNDAPAQAASLTVGTHQLRLVDFDDYFAVPIALGGLATVTATYNAAELDLTLQLFTAGGTLLGEVDGSSGVATLTRPVSSGTCIVHLAKVHKWGGAYTLQIEVQESPGDFDGDGDIDLDDFAHVQACLSGAGVTQNLPACLDARLDGDDDVDSFDMQILRACMGGANLPPHPNCGL